MSASIETTVDRARILRCETRLEIWCLLDANGMYVSDIASTAAVSIATTSYHLAILHRVGLVECVRQGRNHLYRWVPGQRMAIVTEAELEQGGIV
jgi:DNA-binding transcriptional ArsR family regulator